MKSAYGSAHGVQRVSFPSEGVAYLHGLYVNPKFRGLGEGKSIMSEVMADADREGIVLSLHTRPDLVPFFEKFGFQAHDEQKFGLYMTRQPKLKEAVDDINVKDMAGDFSYEPREVWAKKHLAWDKENKWWEIPGTSYSKVEPGGISHANFESFKEMFEELVPFEFLNTVGLRVDQAGLEAMAHWNTFKTWVVEASSGTLIDQVKLSDVNWTALEYNWKKGLAAEAVEALAEKFGSEFKSASWYQDLERFLLGPNGLRWFLQQAEKSEPDWEDDIPTTFSPGEFVDNISFEELRAQVYPQTTEHPELPLGDEPPAGHQPDMFEGVDDDMKGLIRGIKRGTPQFIEDFMNEHFPWDESYEMWELGGFCNFGGSLADRSNCAYFEKKYPGLVTTEYGGLGSETVGIKKADLKKLDADTLDSLAQDLAAIQDNVIIDDEAHYALESDLRQEAWENWVAWDFVRALTAHFPEHEELLWEYKSDPLMRALFEDAREKAGEEWFEEGDRGGDQTVRLDPIIRAVTDEMIREWLMGIGEGLKAKPEQKKFSVVMAPASPELTDAVIRWGKMFITNDKLYHDDKDPDGFGREHEVHVTVKFGLHEPEPSDELLSIIEETQPFEIEIGPCSLFDTNPAFDVVKFDCDGEALRALNARISQLKNSDSHPEYHPHMTVAYVIKGTCQDLIGKPLFSDQEPGAVRFLAKAVLFRGASGEKIHLFLGKPNLELMNESSTEDFLSGLSYRAIKGFKSLVGIANTPEEFQRCLQRLAAMTPEHIAITQGYGPQTHEELAAWLKKHHGIELPTITEIIKAAAEADREFHGAAQWRIKWLTGYQAMMGKSPEFQI